jgi:hypothetical protein
VVAGSSRLELASAVAAAAALNLETSLLVGPRDTCSECSTVAVAYKVLRDGHDTWKIHFMDLVDEFRRGLDPKLLLLPPPAALPLELRALLAGIVVTLADEVQMAAPNWTRKRWTLPRPWFVSGSESLKAMALLESPLAFRRYNIFVTSNFLSRA